MADSQSMEKRASVPVSAVVAAICTVLALLFVASGPAFAGNGSSTPSTSTTSSSTTTTLPAVPNVPPSDTDGQSAQSLLATAIELSSVGIDRSALTAAIDATQVQLDADANETNRADAAAAAANKVAVAATRQAAAATAAYQSMSGAVRDAVLYLYTTGPASLQVQPGAGQALLFAQDYAYSALSPYGILQTHAKEALVAKRSLAQARSAESEADRYSAKAAKALAAEQKAASRLEAELASIVGGSAIQVTADHLALATQAGKELLDSTSLQFTPQSPIPAPVSTTPVALTWAFSELGKPYVWGATGPDTFDCSGLTQFAWKAAGVQIPRVAADQDAWSIPVPLSQLLPGDLVFYGRTDIHHVGIYIGDGLMINAPHTGTVVQVSSIWWSDLAGFGRVHAPGTPIPPHQPPSATKPASPQVVPTAGPVPSQTKPPPGWTPKPGSTTPIVVSGITPSGATTTTTTSTTTTSVPDSTTVPVLPSTTTTTSSTTSTTSDITSTTTDASSDPSVPTGT